MNGSSPRVGHHVAGDLELHEPVVGHVGVERGDHPVAVAPRLRLRLHARTCGPGPRRSGPRRASAAPTSRRSAELASSLSTTFANASGDVVREERIDLFRRRRQAGEVEVHAANERALVGGRDGLQALFIPLRVNEAVDLRFVFRFSDFEFPGRPEVRTGWKHQNCLALLDVDGAGGLRGLVLARVGRAVWRSTSRSP